MTGHNVIGQLLARGVNQSDLWLFKAEKVKPAQDILRTRLELRMTGQLKKTISGDRCLLGPTIACVAAGIWWY
jgi:hypothetical protein